MDRDTVSNLLAEVASGKLSPDEALEKLRWQPVEPIGDFARLDHHRALRQSMPEFVYGEGKSPEQLAAIQSEGQELLAADVAPVLDALSARVDAAVAELRTIDVTTLGHFRGVGRAQLPSTVIGCLVHGAEHAMRHVGQLSVTSRIVRSMRET